MSGFSLITLSPLLPWKLYKVKGDSWGHWPTNYQWRNAAKTDKCPAVCVRFVQKNGVIINLQCWLLLYPNMEYYLYTVRILRYYTLIVQHTVFAVSTQETNVLYHSVQTGNDTIRAPTDVNQTATSEWHRQSNLTRELHVFLKI